MLLVENLGLEGCKEVKDSSYARVRKSSSAILMNLVKKIQMLEAEGMIGYWY